MKAVWKRNSTWPICEDADATIDSLVELIDIVPVLTSAQKDIPADRSESRRSR
jgi:hypothetical protein